MSSRGCSINNVTFPTPLNGKNGWRLDFDPNNVDKAMHINWWNTPNPLNPNFLYRGSIKIEQATQDLYHELISHFPRKTQFIGSVK